MTTRVASIAGPPFSTAVMLTPMNAAELPHHEHVAAADPAEAKSLERRRDAADRDGGEHTAHAR